MNPRTRNEMIGMTVLILVALFFVFRDDKVPYQGLVILGMVVLWLIGILVLWLEQKSATKSRLETQGYTFVRSMSQGKEIWAKRLGASSGVPERVLLSFVNDKGYQTGYKVMFMDDIESVNEFLKKDAN